MFKKLLPFLFIFVVVVLLYYPVLSTYFSQDDFFHFKISLTNGSLYGFINLFGFHSFEERGIAFYRPISRELVFNVAYLIFGLNSLPLRIFSFLIHFINIYLVYLVVRTLSKNKNLSYFVAFFFGITSANVATLYYLSGGIQTLLATTFILMSLLFFYQYLKVNSLKFKILSFFTFLLAISSHEQAIIIPFLILGLILISQRRIKNYLLDLLPYFLIIIILSSLEVFVIGFSSSEQQYQPIFNIKTAFNSLFWYSSWAMGIPETLIDFVNPGFRLNPTLLRYWSNYYIFIFPAFFISIGLLIIEIVYLIIKRSSIFKNKVFLFSLFWFPLGLLPVILLPLHKSTHYLLISLPAFWTLIGLILFEFYQRNKIRNLLLNKLYLSLIILGLMVLSTTSAILGSNNYWAATRGKIAERLITDLKNKYPTLPKSAIVYFKNDPDYPYVAKDWGGTSKQANLVLNGSDALQLLYKDPTLKVFYEDLLFSQELKGKNIYSITAKIF